MSTENSTGLGDFHGHREAVALSVPPHPTLETFAGAFNQLALEVSMQPLNHVSIEIAGLVFAHPVELCLLRQLTVEAARLARSVSVNMPTNPDVASYVQRMDAFACLPPNVTLASARSVKRNDLEDRLVEAFPIGSQTDVDRLATSIDKVAQARVEIPRPLKLGLVSAITEAASNVVEHAKSPSGGVAAAQYYSSRGSLQIAVVDVGLGIPTTLKTHPHLADLSDTELVKAAFDLGTSRYASQRGAGLPGVVQKANRANRFILEVGSGNARVSIQTGVTGPTLNLLHRDLPIPGTWLQVTLFQ